MRWYRKVAIVFLTVNAVSFFSLRFGQASSLPEKFELVWQMRPCLSTPVSVGTHAERSTFMQFLSLYDAAYNKNVTKLNIVMDSSLDLTIAQAQEIATIIMCFRKMGKRVHVWSNGIHKLSQFIVFSACSKRYLNMRENQVILPGLGVVAEFEYNKLQKEKIRVYGIQDGDYKGGLAPYLSNGFDYYAAANMRALFNDVVAQARTILAQLLNKDVLFIEQLLQQQYFTANQAIELGLADDVQLYSALTFNDTKQSACVNLDRYVARVTNHISCSSNRVYVVNIDFPLVGYVCTLFGRMLQQMAQDTSIKVVVLLLNCPGGSELAIDHIENGLQALRKNGKYIIALVDNVAASGGYMLANCANKIITRPAAIIGSIGGYAYDLDYSQQKKEAGIDRDRIYTHNPSDIITQKAMDAQRASLQETMREFRENTQKHRHLSKKVVEDLAQGQMFSGQAAYTLGLVDSLDGYAGMFELLVALFNHQGFNFVFVPNEIIVRDWMHDR